MSNKGTRFISAVFYFIVYGSAVVITAVVGRFLNNVPGSNAHVTFEVTAAAMTVPVYLGLLVFPQAQQYREGVMAANVVFSYLWLTIFILTVNDWVSGSCDVFPVGQSCAQKKAVVALSFIGFFFMLADTALKGATLYLENRSRRDGVYDEKEDEGRLTARGAGTNGVPAEDVTTNGANGV